MDSAGAALVTMAHDLGDQDILTFDERQFRTQRLKSKKTFRILI